ncbi:alpha-1,4-N-acetylglucosaminyltransferase-like isoform X2 [Cimex lectularius]|uniref:Alpha 1,4-glycosyltransferase domain-containing protein n=1 Tax=Cimex lectularius TaxID=79782 RepID=A0A8I6RUN6_CIMLE|nr:alpha-1,4-N-acetylglucosaminyltransferase-like isoform X2 [Cimex lectularius]
MDPFCYGAKMTYSPKGRFLLPYFIVLMTLLILIIVWLNTNQNFEMSTQCSPSEANEFNGFYLRRKLSSNNNNIFFIESSCMTREMNNSKGIRLNSRQACAIYSAAKKNPTRYIVLFHSCPLDNDFYEKASPVIKELLDLPNVAIVSKAIIDIYTGSLLEPLIHSGKIFQSQYPIEHNADILRIFLVYLFGGAYMDMDVVSLKPLDDLGHNFIGAQEETQLGSGVFQFDFDGNGHEYLKRILQEVVQNYDPYTWAGNGPVLAGHVLQKFCNMSAVIDWRIVGKIPGCNITVHPPKVFYPIEYSSWSTYYNESKADYVKEQLKETYVVHVWNHLSRQADVIIGSNQPYGNIAKEHCAPIYWKSKHHF